MSSLQAIDFLLLVIVLLLVAQFTQARTRNYPGTCNAASSNCGTACNVRRDCPGGDCWAEPESCSYAGVCNAASSNCGTACNILSHCPGGDCWINPEICPTSPTYPGTCNAASSNCGTPCNIESDCPGGDCWAKQESCSYTGTCNAGSSNCGAPCNILSDCHGGDCKMEPDICTTAGYCNAASINCGKGCNVAEDCPNGNCKADMESCKLKTCDHVIGTYLGALPAGLRPPPLSSVNADVNIIQLGFAKDPYYNGQFVPFSEWTRLGITKTTITEDKTVHPDRKYLVSIGGAVGFGGTFDIQEGMSVDEWLDAAYSSIKTIIDDLNADGVDIQFEGGTHDDGFPEAIMGLLERFNVARYLTSVGPYFGGVVWDDYARLNLENADYVFCQFYATDRQTVDAVENDITQAAGDLGSWDKLVAGFNSNNRNPNPSIALQAVYNLRLNLKGTFTWSAENSQYNSPVYCIEENSKKILVDNQLPGACLW